MSSTTSFQQLPVQIAATMPMIPVCRDVLAGAPDDAGNGRNRDGRRD